MTFDPISHASGIGAGQQQGRIEGEIAAGKVQTRARIAEIEADGARDTATVLAMAVAKERNEKTKLVNEIGYRWIPYGVSMKASMLANRVERNMFIDELKRLDPSNAEDFARKARAQADAEYNRLTHSPDEWKEIARIVQEESEAERLDQ